MKTQFERKELAATFGSRESSKVMLEVDMKTGQAELVISKTFTERYPTAELNEVLELQKDLHAGNGRRAYSLRELTK